MRSIRKAMTQITKRYPAWGVDEYFGDVGKENLDDTYMMRILDVAEIILKQRSYNIEIQEKIEEHTPLLFTDEERAQLYQLPGNAVIEEDQHNILAVKVDLPVADSVELLEDTSSTSQQAGADKPSS